MDISRRLSNEDTATSMYLSFDAESTMSTACYKTLDISALSAVDADDSVDRNGTGENQINSTLEALNDSQIMSPLKTVKKVEMPEIKSYTPLRALPKNILKEYKALCSTPSKEQLLKTVDVTRGSDSTRCVDLGLAFLGVEDEKPPYFPRPSAGENEENKENALPESEEVSTLSTCSSVEIASIIERKMLSSVSAVASIREESVEKEKIMKNVEEILVSTNMVDKILIVNDSVLDAANNSLQIEEETANLSELSKLNHETTPKDKVEIVKYMDTIAESIEKSDEKTSVVKELENAKKKINKKSSSKPKIAVFSRNARRSMCEANLQANKSSRIHSSGNKRQSLLPTSRKSITNMDAEIPLLLSKMLKITNNTPMEDEKVEVKRHQEAAAEKRRSIMASTKTRTSLIPSAAGDKRPFSFTQRMSVVIKTTLNSPARKIPRKSSVGGVTTSLQRRSVIPQKTTTAESSKIKKPEEIVARKSMLPKTSTITSNTTYDIKTLAPLQDTSVKPTSTAQRKCLYTTAKDKFDTVAVGLSHNKPDIAYTCNVCKEKFRIKSLLDAHKRSHESDNVAPAFIKKPTTVSLPSGGSMLGGLNQCKYCDKKFALTRALHIHLLQNCSKIPPSEKRKLQYTDLNHVEKAQLPNVFTHNLQSNASSSISSANATPRHSLKLKVDSFAVPKSSTQFDNKDIHKITSDLVATVDGNKLIAFQGSVQKIKKRTAHAGVYRTPSKSVPCHLCKLTFKSILDYTNHNLTVHGRYKTNITEDTDNVVVEENSTTNKTQKENEKNYCKQ